MSIESHLEEHLARWGLREFAHGQDYDEWQRNSLSPQVLHQLHELATQRQGGADPIVDQQFYDLASTSAVLPVLYSQRFGYYRAVGEAMHQHFQPGESVLDFGCGVGILTTWYASLFPDCVFTGVDRSAQSIAVARRQAEVLELENISFHSCEIPEGNLPGIFDLIISSQALFQSETDPGLPSRSWEGFDREHDAIQQSILESRTGIGERLDWLLVRLNPLGRLVVFEKTSHLGRRIFFQRALAARGFHCDRDPVFLRHASFDESIVDGPLYSLMLKESAFQFAETPSIDPLEQVYRCRGKHANLVWEKFCVAGHLEEPEISFVGDHEIHWHVCRASSGLMCGRVLVPGVFTGVLVAIEDEEEILKAIVKKLMHREGEAHTLLDVLGGIWPMDDSAEPAGIPIYENHSSGAQAIWKRLVDRKIFREITRTNVDGQEYHAEVGHCAGPFVYLYWANTHDQRQIVVMDVAREAVLLEYFSQSEEEA